MTYIDYEDRGPAPTEADYHRQWHYENGRPEDAGCPWDCYDPAVLHENDAEQEAEWEAERQAIREAEEARKAAEVRDALLHFADGEQPPF